MSPSEDIPEVYNRLNPPKALIEKVRQELESYKEHLRNTVNTELYIKKPLELKKLFPGSNFTKITPLNKAVDRGQGESINYKNTILPIHKALMVCFSSFIEAAYELNSEFKEILGNRLKGQIVVDLGSGTGNRRDLPNVTLPIYNIAKKSGVENLILVEPYFPVELSYTLGNIKQNSGDNTTNTWVIAENMLNFLARLPDHSVSIVTSAIDHCIIVHPRERAAISAQIERVLHPDGVYISVRSEIPTSNFNKLGQFTGAILADDVELYTK